MTADKIFVGRKTELEQFKKVIEDPQGQAVLVVGNRGMGKTWLINKMAELAENHPNFECGCVRYEVTPTDSVDSTMALIMDNAFEATQVVEESFDRTPRRLQQWKALLNIIKIGDLVMSLRRDPAKNTRSQFLERLQLISKRMPENGRAIFIIDPEKYMQKDSDQSWALVVKGLPDKIKLVFAQRTEDVLVESATFAALDNISCIPENRLDVLEEQAVDDLLNQRVTDMDYSVTEVRKILSKYKGHPYALQGALDLLKAGTKLEELPQDPTGIAAAQWKELCKRGKDAIRLFKAYAILEVGVPNEVVTAVSKLDNDTLQSILADNFLGGLLREEGYGKRIYHAILSDYILEQIGEAEKKEYNNQAVEIYRERLHKDTKPDALGATRLPEHILVAEGEMVFVQTFVNECGIELQFLGFLDAFVSLSERALGYAAEDSKWEATLLGNLGLIYLTRGDLDKAEQMFKKSLEIDEKLGLLEGMANQYGNLGVIYLRCGELDKAEEMYNKVLEIEDKLGHWDRIGTVYGNLGVIYKRREDLDKAEQMYIKSLEIDEKLGKLESMANQYGNLGLIYRKRGVIDKAEHMLMKSLEINEKLGWLEGIAKSYSNLGLVYQERGNLEKAREYWEKALVLFKKIGMKPEIEKTQQLIDELEDK